MSTSAIPHLASPLRVAADGALVTLEQDTPEEVMQCVAALLGTAEGDRLEVPDYGLPDQVFTLSGTRAAVMAAIERWEPRALAVVTEEAQVLDDLVRRVRVQVDVRQQ